MASVYQLNLDLHTTQSNYALPITAEDTDRELWVSFSDGGRPVSLEGVTAIMTINWTPPEMSEGDPFGQSDKLEIKDGSYAVASLDKFQCNYPGEYLCEIDLAKGGKNVASPKFTLSAAHRLKSCGGNVPDSATNNFLTLISETNTAKDAATAAAGLANDAADYATAAKEEATAAARAALEAKNTIEQAAAEGKFNGEKGEDGADGKDGTGVSITNIEETDEGTIITFSDGNAVSLKNGNSGKSAYEYAQDGGYIGNESDFSAKLAQPIPTKTSDVTNDSGFVTTTTVNSTVNTHNTSDEAHNDIRLELKALADRINAVLDSDDTTLDELSEIVTYIKSNKTLIEAITVNKVNVADIIDNLTTNVSNKPLSAAQGVVLKTLVDALQKDKLDADELTSAINAALAEAKASGEFDGENGAQGQRGPGILKVTTAPTSYTTTTAGVTPIKRMLISTIKTQSGLDEVLVGDQIAHSYYHYRVYYVDDSYAYMDKYQSNRGATGAAGAAGKDGTSVTVSSVTESTESGGSNVVSFSDGNTLTVKNGKDGADEIPDYVKAEAEEVADKVISSRTANSLVLLMATDMHELTRDAAAYERNKIAIEHLGMGMAEIRKHARPDAVVLLGDYVYETTTLDKAEAKSAMKRVIKSLHNATNGIPSIWLDGNHDHYQTSGDYRLTDGENYALVGANNSQEVEVDVDNLTRNYGYIDFKKQRIRLIYLNTTDISGGVVSANHITDTQGQWLINTALDLSDKADADKWGIVVCSHFPIHMYSLSEAYYGTEIFGDLKSVLCNFKDKTSGTNYGISYDFTNATAELIATFHGHIHNFKVHDVETSGGNIIKAICIPNGCQDRENPYTGDFQEIDSNGNAVSYPKTADTAEDTSFNAVVIDRDSKTIHAICYGAGYDREISYEDVETIINQIPISTDASGAIYGEDYNGDGENDGYKINTRVGSDGTDRANATGKYATGFIPVKQGDIVYLANCQIIANTTYNQVFFYKADKSTVITYRDVAVSTATYWGFVFDDNNCLTQMTMNDTSGTFDLSEVAYVRFAGNYIGDDSIITVNQPIE